MPLSPLQGSAFHRIITGGLHPRLWSVAPSGLLTSPIYRINAQNYGLQKERELCVHFYRTPIIIIIIFRYRIAQLHEPIIIIIIISVPSSPSAWHYSYYSNFFQSPQNFFQPPPISFPFRRAQKKHAASLRDLQCAQKM